MDSCFVLLPAAVLSSLFTDRLKVFLKCSYVCAYRMKDMSSNIYSLTIIIKDPTIHVASRTLPAAVPETGSIGANYISLAQNRP